MIEPTESAKFDAAVRKILSVSRDELMRREKQWKQERKRVRVKNRAKVSKSKQNRID